MAQAKSKIGGSPSDQSKLTRTGTVKILNAVTSGFADNKLIPARARASNQYDRGNGWNRRRQNGRALSSPPTKGRSVAGCAAVDSIMTSPETPSQPTARSVLRLRHALSILPSGGHDFQGEAKETLTEVPAGTLSIGHALQRACTASMLPLMAASAL